MIRRLVVALVAMLIAAVGGILTFLYASNADARALAQLAPVQVLVVAESVPAGTTAEALARSVAVTEVPGSAVVPGAVTDLADIAGLAATTDLVAGEQLLRSRFDAPEAVGGEIEVPSDMHELTVRLDSQRVIGGELQVGDTVGVFVSAELTVVAPDGAETTTDVTHLILHKALVTAVQGAVAVTTDEDGNQVEEAAQDQIMVTLALSAADAEEVVWGQEFGSVWLSLEGAEVPETGTRVVTAEEVFQ